MIRNSIHGLEAYVPGEQPEGSGVLKLNTNENPYPPSPAVFEALGAVDADLLRKYPHPTGRVVVQAIAGLHELDPEQVIVTNGSDEGLALCTRAYCEHGGTAGYLSPSYSLYPVLGKIAELTLQPIPLPPDFAWRVPEVLDVDLFFLTQPNAPTGMALPLDGLRKAAKACRGVLIIDEAYVDFADENAVPLLSEADNVLISRTFSKSYSLAGIRMGYLMGAPELIEALYKIKDSYNTDALAQKAALAAVKDQNWMIANATAIRGTRASLTASLADRGFTVLPSQANFVFARVPEGRDAREIFEALKARQVYVRYFPGGLTGSYLRITVGTDEQMDRFLMELDQVLTAAGQ